MFPEIFATTFADDSRLLSLAFDAMRYDKAVDLSLTLIEELLHSTRHRPDFDLSSVPHLPALVNSLGPLQLGAFCRVLAPLVDEREVPFCGGDHCSGACKQSAQATSLDWHHIEPSAKRLRARRSYVDAASRVIRDRNHASVLAIPGLLEKLVKLISVPPVPSDNLAVVDHMPRAELSGVKESWKDFDARIERAVRDHARAVKGQQGLARARRRMSGSEWLGAGQLGQQGFARARRRMSGSEWLGAVQRIAPGNPYSVVEFAALIGMGQRQAESLDMPNASREPELSPEPHAPLEAAPADIEPTEGERSPTTSPRPRSLEAEVYTRLLMSALQVEVLFVLYSLLTGKRKREVQVRLVNAGIFEVIIRFCDGLKWLNSGKEKRTEEALKVHLIRLLHYVWDGLDFIPANERLEMLFAPDERFPLKTGGYGHAPGIACTGPNITSPSSVSSQEPLVLAMHRLSLTACADLIAVQNGGLGVVETDVAATALDDEIETTIPHEGGSPLRSKELTESASNVTPVEVHGDGGRRAKSGIERMGSHRSVPLAPDQGIVCKMADILMRAHADDEAHGTRRYLLAGCMETYLRSASIGEKRIVARHGLLLHLLSELSKHDKLIPQLSQFRQTSFDLLGQLVKGSRELFSFMNTIFRQDPKLLSGLLITMSDSLIDSNVFVRSLVISLECFREEDKLARNPNTGITKEQYDFTSCLLWDFLETNRLRLIQDLITSVRVEDVNFENICCVNTSLILMVISYPTEKALDLALLHILNNILLSEEMEKFGQQNFFGLNPMDIFSNFDKLVSFWFSYYQHQSLDVASQELNSNIRFERLIAVANLLKVRLPLLDAKLKREANLLQLQKE